MTKKQNAVFFFLSQENKHHISMLFYLFNNIHPKWMSEMNTISVGFRFDAMHIFHDDYTNCDLFWLVYGNINWFFCLFFFFFFLSSFLWHHFQMTMIDGLYMIHRPHRRIKQRQLNRMAASRLDKWPELLHEILFQINLCVKHSTDAVIHLSMYWL